MVKNVILVNNRAKSLTSVKVKYFLKKMSNFPNLIVSFTYCESGWLVGSFLSDVWKATIICIL